MTVSPAQGPLLVRQLEGTTGIFIVKVELNSSEELPRHEASF
jgi:hypothetical protein